MPTVELGVHMQPTATMLKRQLAAVKAPVDLLDARSHVAGGEVSMRVCEAPGIPGKWLGAVIEQWPDGHVEILGACHADSATGASVIILPQLERILRARKV